MLFFFSFYLYKESLNYKKRNSGNSYTQVHYILAELVMGGMVLETNMTEIITRIEEQAKLEKQEVSVHKISV